MEDVIHNKIPLGPIGVLANYLFVQKKLGSIFVYRRKKLIELFGDLKWKISYLLVVPTE